MSGCATFLFAIFLMLIVSDKYVTQSKYINKTKTKQKQTNDARYLDPSFVTFYNKLMGFCIHRSSVVD